MTWGCPCWEETEVPNDELLSVLNDAYSEQPYPTDFLARYVPIACLAERSGIDTLLVEDADRRRYVAKCFDKTMWSLESSERILEGLDHPGLPRYEGTFEDERTIVTVRAYVEGVSLERYAQENDLEIQEIVGICVQLCDILAYLHHRQDPIIHRDIKPANVIVRPDGSVVLIDFDIARVYRQESETDTRFFGTQAYAPPEQYGFAQTDARTDIYALGVLLRYLLTGSPRDNKNIRVYRPLAKIIDTCTQFAPSERYADIDQVRRQFLHANPAAQRRRLAGIALGVALTLGLLSFGGVSLYRWLTYSPFTSDAVPAALADEERVQDAVAYLQDKYDTHLFDQADDTATIGLVRQVLVELYGLDREYVNSSCPEDLPVEGDGYFFPWGYEDTQTVDRDTMVYIAVKAHDPAMVADWSSLKDDNGYYPGVRVAVAFAERTNIMVGVGRPKDITVGEMAIILANTDRVFDAAEGKSS